MREQSNAALKKWKDEVKQPLAPARQEGTAATTAQSLQDAKFSIWRIQDASQGQPWSQGLIMALTGMALGFGVIVLIIMATVAVKKGNSIPFLRLFSVPLIVIAAVFLVIAGFSNSQISPVIGLLGTIAGYLLGSEARSTPPASGTSGLPLPSKPGAVSWDPVRRELVVASFPSHSELLRVFRKTAGANPEPAGEGTSLIFKLNQPTALVPGTQYEAWVVGTNATGGGPESDHVTFTA